MGAKGLKTILLFLSLGLFIIWFLEFRRTTLADSYWMLLLVLVSLLSYQLINLKQAGAAAGVKEDMKVKTEGLKKGKRGVKPGRENPKRKNK